MEDSSNSIVEERTELMVSPAGKNVKLRVAHFIKPSTGLDSIDETPVANLPRHCLSSLPTSFEPKKWPLEVKFCGWRNPQENWKTWVVKTASLHESTWKKAGIFEGIMNSTYKIERNNDLVFGIAEKWCHETKSFIFSWGEATITLEDVMILGGYSVLGSPVFTPVETEEMKETLEKLTIARKEIYTSTNRKVLQTLWMRKFMHSGSEVEHEALLALWLSRFVLPSSFDVVVESVFPIAIHFARGTRIALAPAVLARIYSDLSRLKRNIVASALLDSKWDGENVALAVTLWSPLSLVQVWIWERFLKLQPKPNLIENGKPRLAFWHGLKCKAQDVRSLLDSAMGRFDWRPYVRNTKNCVGAKVYGDKAMWIAIDSSSDDEVLSFARCLRASELVGLDCIEQYLPHRVALQFGMDQDIPGCVLRSNASPEIAWSDYNKSVDGWKLYIPSRLFESDVTTRYLEWWKQSVLSLQETVGMNESDVLTRSKMIPRGLKRPMEDDNCIGFRVMPKKFKGMREGKGFSGSNNASMSHEFPPKSSKGLGLGSEVDNEGENETASNSSLSKPLKELPLSFIIQKELNSSSFPPGFPPKGHMLQAKGSVNEDKVTAQVPPGFPPKENMLQAVFVHEDRVTAPVPPGFTPNCKVVEAKSLINEDKVIPLVHPGFLSKHFDEDEVTLLVPLGFPPKCNKVEAQNSVDKDEVTPLVVPGISPNKNTLEVRDFKDKVTETIVISACYHESMGNKVGRNYEKSTSHLQSLSLDSHDEDQLTIAEMLKSDHKLDNVNCRDAGENSSGQCQSSSFSIADNEFPKCMEPITTLGAEKVMPGEAASEGSKGATIQDAIESNAGRPADGTVGNNGSLDDKAASINDIEGYGNRCLNEISRLHLEERISRLERLVAEIKAARNVKSLVTATFNLV